MIRVFLNKKKDNYEIIAVADQQKDLNNLRLMSYRLLGKDAVSLNKAEFGGPYIKLKCDEFKKAEGEFDVDAISRRAADLTAQYN